ncbi:MAG: GAF domain-containing protein [Labilithrix sp.]|nr:GAF domain-containing protein [Labilithrix sp.]
MKHSDLPRVLRRAVGLMRFAREAVRASDASLFLLDAEGTGLRGVVSEWDWTRTSFTANVSRWPTVARCLDDGKVRVIAIDDATSTEREWFEPRGVVAAVCVPLWERERAQGVIFFDFDAAGDGFDEDDVPLLADVGYRVARAIAREAPIDPLPVDRAIVLQPASLPAELQQSLDSRIAAAVTDLATAERLLEEAVTALRTGTKEKVVVEPNIERAFARVRATREELVRLQALVALE